MKKRINLFYYYFILIIFLEISNKLIIYKNINLEIIFTICSSIIISLILFLFTKIFKTKIKQYVTTLIISIILIVIFSGSLIYYDLFSVPFSIYTLGLIDQAVDFSNIFFESFFENIKYLLLYFIPLIVLILLRNKIYFGNYTLKKYKHVLIIILTVIMFNLLLIPFKNTAYKYLYENNNLTKSIDTFGLLVGEITDIKRCIFGFEEKIFINEPKKSNVNNIEVKQNILDINLEAKAESTSTEINLLNYFSSSEATNQNEFTGYYEGKNLIFILAEGFNEIAVEKNLTPTLYKLTNTGFVFNNYYSPAFLSTTGGEFQATTGLIPTQDILNIWRNKTPKFSFALGNSFNKIGYAANAYHNWTYTYYKRNLTMPTLGFDNYLGCKNGLEKSINCSWLPSDVDLINATFNNYSSEDKFVTYYISVSGHAPYNFGGGNKISKKNKSLVENLEYSDPVKAYLAAQIEFDRALETLINKLDDKGILDDTVIVITGDHYPYTLTETEINELSDYQKDELFEVHKSNLIIWNNNDEIVKTTNKVGSQIDVLPTILNLFNIKYDSRMIVGKDILSDYPGLAIFSDRSWITDKGRYNSNKKEFTKNNDVDIEDNYVDNINNRVDNSFTISKMIVETDIYRKVLGD